MLVACRRYGLVAPGVVVPGCSPPKPTPTKAAPGLPPVLLKEERTDADVSDHVAVLDTDDAGRTTEETRDRKVAALRKQAGGT
jgi:hypothetical protein